MKRKLRLAIAGFGVIGRKHARLAQSSPDWVLAGIADPAPAARAQAERAGTATFATLEAMLDSARPDAVIVATPNNLHAEGALACIARGLPVLLEKPVTDTVAGARAVIAAAEGAKVPVLIGHHRRHNPIIAKARAVVAAGELGRITAVSAHWLLQKPDPYFEAHWRREPGGGPILINLIHDIDDLRYVCGEIDAVQALTSNAARGFAVEDTAVINVRFANGALGTFTLSDAVPAPWSWEIASGENPEYPTQADENCYLICGTRASLAVPTLVRWDYRDPANSGWRVPLDRERLAVERADPLPLQLAHFRAVVDGDAAPIIDARDGARTLAVVEAIARAARSGHMEFPTQI